MDYDVSNSRHMINSYPVHLGPGPLNYPQHFVFSQSPVFSDISLPLDDLCRSQSAPPCLEQGNNLFNSPLSIPQLFSNCDVFSLAASTHGGVHSSSKEHIPRPPNAFMLYRSHMLKSRGNADPEKRQQNLSRIAGQLWRAMSKEDRAVWHKKAAEVQAAHCAKYPGYKFKPNRKSAKSAKTFQSGAYYSKPTEQVCAESSIGPVRRVRSSRVRPQGVTRDALLGALKKQFPSAFSSPTGLSPLHFPPFLPTFSLPEAMCVNEQPNATLSLPQSQCTNALGLELSSSQPLQPTTPRSGLAEMLSGLDLDATPTATTFQRNGDISESDASMSQDDIFLGMEQLRLPHNSMDYDVNGLSPLLHGSMDGYQSSGQSFSCSDAFSGAPTCTSDSMFSDFMCDFSMPLDHERDEWSNTSWMLNMDKNSNI
ncbi:uncharacterized protein F5891DRAFT_364406 [Suillus fuscotomentosus]|uniref:HMG box domain-containing protein n=1 Tax=Suillus fuscotomentosus TaxID=1912939 RepID=A0AAD4EJH8_9AGAM|nr:uncharacterized protein F5891DRAFT_364406 [Suillus fuscotomentosus]KAG1907265.1 hypothetical protein F5891DRAFT_364406 [Suillus fuscotomentosus]